MPALNFSARFADLVASGEKRQTIRAPRSDGRPHASPGQIIKLYTGMRTKECRLLALGVVESVERVVIHPAGIEYNPGTDRVRSMWEAPLSDLLNCFARSDGFKDWAELRDWFAETHGLPFTGTLIKWRPGGAVFNGRGKLITEN